METQSAVRLVNALVYKPTWTISAESYEHRFESTIVVNFTYEAQRSEREYAPDYEIPIPFGARASYVLPVQGLDDVALYRSVLDAIVDIETHEAREFLRVAPTMWAPFHPHRIDGMNRYGEPERDLHFGLA